MHLHSKRNLLPYSIRVSSRSLTIFSSSASGSTDKTIVSLLVSILSTHCRSFRGHSLIIYSPDSVLELVGKGRCLEQEDRFLNLTSQFRRILLQIQLKLDILQGFLVQYQLKKSANILNVQYVYLCLDRERPFLHVHRVTWFAMCADLKLGYVQSAELRLQVNLFQKGSFLHE